MVDVYLHFSCCSAVGVEHIAELVEESKSNVGQIDWASKMLDDGRMRLVQARSAVQYSADVNGLESVNTKAFGHLISWVVPDETQARRAVQCVRYGTLQVVHARCACRADVRTWCAVYQHMRCK